MIISHKHKYIFIQNPVTASSSIGRELQELYGGESILWKHALYSDFLKQASNEEKGYFVFTGQRNPLDTLVTLYFREKFTMLELVKTRPNADKRMQSKKLIAKWQHINRNDLSFIQYFNLYHSYKINNFYKQVERDKVNFVYRYENLQGDFSQILQAIGIEQERELPQHSKKTERKDIDFHQYYTPEIQSRVQIAFGKSFREMGYSFPDEWIKPGLSDRSAFYKDLMLKQSINVIKYLVGKMLPLN